MEGYKYDFNGEDELHEYVDYLAQKSINIDRTVDSKYTDSIIILDAPVNGQESKKVILAAIKTKAITTTYN